MLPSTGYFKGINCPFYDSGLCERPYCHFRHAKKESINVANDAFDNGAILQKLVSAAVQRVLQQASAETSASVSTAPDEDAAAGIVTSHVVSKATYNPTPISELNKISNSESENNNEITEQKRRHIPVPYTPRKPASYPMKRPINTDDTSKLFIYAPPTPVLYTPGSGEPNPQDPYMPKGSTESNEKYLPGTEKELQKYAPKDYSPSVSKHNYIPSDKNTHKKKFLEYKPTKVNTKSEIPSVSYQPTPRSLAPCFSSDEEEPQTKKCKKLSGDLNSLDDLGPEFDMLDQILDEEKLSPVNEDTSKVNTKVDKDQREKKNDFKKEKYVSDIKENKSVICANGKSLLDGSNITKNREHKKKDRSSLHSKDKKHKSKSSKSSHKSKDKKQTEVKHKSVDINNGTTQKRHHSSSKHSDRHSSSSTKKHKSSRQKNSKESKDKKKRDTGVIISDNDSFNGESINQTEESLEVSDADEETIALECKKIFEEYKPEKKVSKNIENVDMELENDSKDECLPGKKRVSRTVNKNLKVVPKSPLKPDFKLNAVQTMSERLSKIREYHATKHAHDTIADSSKNLLKTDVSKNLFSAPSSKIRIAHVPYASTLINAKKTFSCNNITNNEPSTSSSTTIQTIKKGVQRTAHIPNERFIDRPGVLEPLASKIAANIRSIYLNMMIDECLKIYLCPVDAYARAQHEELTTSKKCSTIPIYKNSAVLTVSRLRKEFQECNGVKKSGTDCSTLQKIPQVVSGKSSNSGSWSIENKYKRIGDSLQLCGTKLYNHLKKWILTEEQLQENGFPRPHVSGVKGRATIYTLKKQNPSKGYLRTCCRCKKEYMVDKKGFPAVKQECIYHPNNKYRVRGEAKYQCCSQDESSDGCCIALNHVFEYIDYENLKGYITTLSPVRELADYGVYSLDCEMCYTTQGLDLTRITVIDSACKVIYETLIKPLHPIIDYNTRYSGITEEQMADVKTTLLEVQAALLTMFNSKTILIGHSLESDFKALKLIHDTVIDTSVLFPHKMGPPYKRALRNLSTEYLKKIIQNSVDGHDSAEDATVCMELVIFKLKEDLKTR